MPKIIRYKANSVVYFSGDFDDRIFLLNTGNIALTSVDIESGTKTTDYIKTGEFFGVKSALGNYPREEDAMVMTDSVVYAFSSAEFEIFAQKNTRIIMQMIKVFSRQLRTVHKHLASLLDSQEETNSEEGLFNVAQAFYKSQHYQAAGYVAKRYKQLYPSGRNISQITHILNNSSDANGLSFGGSAAEAVNVIENTKPDRSDRSTKDSAQLSFSFAEDLASKNIWDKAYDQYHAVIESGVQGEIFEASYIGAARCLYGQEEFARCLQLLTGFISQNPKSLKIAEALMYLGMCYQGMSRPDKAIAFYDKALLLAGPLLVPKIKTLQENCEKELK